MFAEALSDLLDEAIMGTLDEYELGIRCFDDLIFGQEISILKTSCWTNACASSELNFGLKPCNRNLFGERFSYSFQILERRRQ